MLKYPKIELALQLFRDIQPDNPDAIKVFGKEFLGLDFHVGQQKWLDNSSKVIDILKPANQWGKTMILSVEHIYEMMVRPRIFGRVSTPKVWASIRYETLNFGKTYEVARGVLETVEDIAEGAFLLPTGDTNKSLLAGWAIKAVINSQNKPPEIVMMNDSGRIIIRSYDDLGAAFKRKRLPYVSGDECGDIPELNLFVTGTLLPRVSFFKGRIHLVGTSQPAGIEYEELALKAQEAMEHEKETGEESDYYFQTGPVYENPYLDPIYVKRIENVADPELRRQIIYGEYVDYAEHYFQHDEVSNLFREELPYDEESGFSEDIARDGLYVLAVDNAATKDEFSLTAIRYGQKIEGPDRKLVLIPYRIVFHKAFVGEAVPLSSQYEMTRMYTRMFRERGQHCVLVYDGQSLGGKNVSEQLEEMHGRSFPPPGMSGAQAKAEALGSLKEVLSRGRQLKIMYGGARIDTVETWGFLRASSNIKALRRQFDVYKLDDKKLTQDRLMTVAMAIHFIEKRMPSASHKLAIPFDLNRSIGVYKNVIRG